MEVDIPVEVQAGSSRRLEATAGAAEGRAAGTDEAYVVSDSGSSTEVDEDEDEGRGQAATPRLPATWAFSQRAVGGSTITTPVRRRLRWD